MTEKEFQKQVMVLARTLGWLVGHVSDSRKVTARGHVVPDKDAAGIPDLILVHPAREQVLFRELKQDRGQLRPAQRVWLAALTEAGADADVWRPRDWDRIVSELGGERA